MPTTGQLALLCCSILLFAAGAVLAFSGVRSDRPRLRAMASACTAAGLLIGMAVLVWHSISRGRWLPLEDNFDALIWLGLLLALLVVYMQATRPLVGFDGFILPIVTLLLVAAAVFGKS